MKKDAKNSDGIYDKISKQNNSSDSEEFTQIIDLDEIINKLLDNNTSFTH